MVPFSQFKIRGVVFLATIVSCFIAFYNNFPLVYQDTGTYISSGFEPIVPMDRPIFYGRFIRFISLSESLWLVVLAQGLLACYLIYLTLGLFFENDQRSWIFISCITFLTLCTGFSYNVSILIPDIFSALVILCLINLLLNHKLTRSQTVFIQLVFVFSICTQFSSIPVLMAVFALLLLYAAIRRLRKKTWGLDLKKFFISFGLVLSCLFIIPAVHYSYDRQFKISGANHVFAMQHLLETGILHDYLSEACPTHDYKICAYKDSLGWEFIWSPNSPAMKTGGWEANRKEYKAIIVDVIKTPKYFKVLAIKAAEYTLKQFFTFDVTVTPNRFLSAPYGQIGWRYNSSINDFICSRQYREKLDLAPINMMQQMVVLLSMVFLLVVLLTPYLLVRLRPELKAAVALLMLHNVISAGICSNLSTVSERFQNRLAWLLPLFAIVVVFELLDHKKSSKTGLSELK